MKFIKVKDQYGETIIQIDQITTIAADKNGNYVIRFSTGDFQLNIDNNDAQMIFREIGVSL